MEALNDMLSAGTVSFHLVSPVFLCLCVAPRVHLVQLAGGGCAADPAGPAVQHVFSGPALQHVSPPEEQEGAHFCRQH